MTTSSNTTRKIYFLFAATIFIGSGLLFLVQPMIAKAILPLAGGTPAVWNTCVFFFQTTLLLGYAYAYVLARLSTQKQILVHPLLLLTGIAAASLLFATVQAPTPGQTNYAFWVLGYLAKTVGWLVLLLAANGILLQRWFATTTHDPYHLYAASNAGSFVALLAYPFLLEPFSSITQQKRYWAIGFVIFVITVIICAWQTRKNADLGWRLTDFKSEAKSEQDAAIRHPPSAISAARRLQWIFWAFVPSSLMLGVTTFVTTDIAPAPLFWIIPLAIYLLAFTLAFARRQIISTGWLMKLLPGAAILLILVYAAKATEPAWLLILVHLLFFALASLLAHQRLAEDRPDVSHLAEFYVWIAVGGALGGFFNSLLAPMIFNDLNEYPLTIVLACLLIPIDSETWQDTREQRTASLLAILLGVIIAGLSWYASRLEIGMLERVALVFAAPLFFINHFMTANALRLTFALGAVLLGSSFFAPEVSKTLFAGRNYFGALRVTLDRANTTRSLYHGTTIHGRQFLTPGRQCEPLAYFHPTGPVGQVFAAHAAGKSSPNVAVIGLGTGAMAGYSRKGQNWTYYEINPLVIQLARDTGHFTYLHLCSRAPFEIIEGDARHTLQQAPVNSYGLILMDAFNSDAIPVHLMSQESLNLYLSKLAPGGIIVFQVSNRHLNLQPILANLAQSKNLVCKGFDDRTENPAIFKEPSTWVAMARAENDFGEAMRNWQTVPADSRMRVWSDDYSNILQALRW